MEEKKISRIFMHLFLIIIAIIMILPFVWMVLTSFKSVTESTQMNPFVIFPSQWRIENYIEVIKGNDFLALYINTFLMMIFRVICSVLFSAMAAYAFCKIRISRKKFSVWISLIPNDDSSASFYNSTIFNDRPD